ncbi:MAG: hypothetical protein ABI837_06945, partial [Acidobacteriota bacterium]
MIFPVAVAIALPILAYNTTEAAAASAPAIPPAVKRAMPMFSGDAMKAHDRFLASDLLEGRGPGTRGDDLAMEYIAAQFEAAGLKPDGDDGTYYQKVALLGTTYDPSGSSLSFTKDGGTPIPLKYRDEFVGTDQSQSENS